MGEREKLINFKVSAEERDALKTAAEACDLSLSAWLREIALGAAGVSRLHADIETAAAKAERWRCIGALRKARREAGDSTAETWLRAVEERMHKELW